MLLGVAEGVGAAAEEAAGCGCCGGDGEHGEQAEEVVGTGGEEAGRWLGPQGFGSGFGDRPPRRRRARRHPPFPLPLPQPAAPPLPAVCGGVFVVFFADCGREEESRRPICEQHK